MYTNKLMKVSAGILMYRKRGQTEFLLVHPGGPFFAKKDAGWWTIPKGELLPGEDALECAIREFKEETGYTTNGPYIPLSAITQKAGKKVMCWAAEGDIDANTISSNTFEVEWPPKSGRKMTYPEVDRAGWFAIDEARKLINERQAAFLDELAGRL